MQISINNMSTKEKLELMEMLWNDLSKNEKEIQSPDWHKQTLKQREKKSEAGKEKIIDWDDAKNDLHESS